MSYTAAELKTYTSIPAVSGWADAKILLYQGMAESALASLNMDTTVAGYQTAHDGALVLLFDYVAENPTGLKSRSQGKTSATYADDLPANVKVMLEKYIKGGRSALQGAGMLRKDIGLR